ncbi:hypothetical protein MHH67_06575 [Bacillus sp. FSL K6-0047]
MTATGEHDFTEEEVAAIQAYLENNSFDNERVIAEVDDEVYNDGHYPGPTMDARVGADGIAYKNNIRTFLDPVADFFFGDFLALTAPEASLGEKALATTFILVKPAKVGGVIYDLSKARKVKTGGKGNSKWKSAELLDELESSGIKYNPDEVMAITKTANGKLVWLEKGNSNAGFEHVMRHADEFAVKGIKSNEIPDLLVEALTKGKVVGTQGRRNSRPIYEVVFNGQKQRVAITVGNNGFIVGANPKSLP